MDNASHLERTDLTRRLFRCRANLLRELVLTASGTFIKQQTDAFGLKNRQFSYFLAL